MDSRDAASASDFLELARFLRDDAEIRRVLRAVEVKIAHGGDRFDRRDVIALALFVKRALGEEPHHAE